MAQTGNFLTPEGLAKLERELEHLRTVRRPEIAERIQRAKESRSAVNTPEYEEAKNEQGFVEGRILELENIIASATIIDPDTLPTDSVQLGSRVIVRHRDGREDLYIIVGSAEADPSEGKISYVSPVGGALLGRHVGDIVEVPVPAGMRQLTIVEIK